jgi:hypothetical protein
MVVQVQLLLHKAEVVAVVLLVLVETVVLVQVVAAVQVEHLQSVALA